MCRHLARSRHRGMPALPRWPSSTLSPAKGRGSHLILARRLAQSAGPSPKSRRDLLAGPIVMPVHHGTVGVPPMSRSGRCRHIRERRTGPRRPQVAVVGLAAALGIIVLLVLPALGGDPLAKRVLIATCIVEAAGCGWVFWVLRDEAAYA